MTMHTVFPGITQNQVQKASLEYFKQLHVKVTVTEIILRRKDRQIKRGSY